MTRSDGGQTDSTLRFGDVMLDTATHQLSGKDGSFNLANKEFQVLELLMRNPSHLIPTERFIERIWGYDSDAELNIVWVYVSYLRKKLAGIGSTVVITAHRNSGYSLELSK